MSDAAHAFRSHDAVVFFDVTPLFDDHWTGIPVVTANLARGFVGALGDRVMFFFEDRIVSSDAVIEALRRNSGFFLHDEFFHGEANVGPLDHFTGRRTSLGFFPSVKRVRNYFDVEASVIHDLSTLITPQFHTVENIRYHLATLIPDLTSNAVTFCVSQATLDDVHAYVGIPIEKLEVAPNGVSWPTHFDAKFASEVGSRSIEPFIVILGTREPRKNVDLLFRTVVMFPHILQNYRLVVVGKVGWLADQGKLPHELANSVNNGRIIFTGFVSEYQKYKLLRAAKASVYPSFFEGFGLPILESMSVGTPCLTTFSSSLPEVAGDSELLYFDPLSPESLAGRLEQLSALSLFEQRSLAEYCIRRAYSFSWASTTDGVLKRLAVAVEGAG